MEIDRPHTAGRPHLTVQTPHSSPTTMGPVAMSRQNPSVLSKTLGAAERLELQQVGDHGSAASKHAPLALGSPPTVHPYLSAAGPSNPDRVKRFVEPHLNYLNLIPTNLLPKKPSSDLIKETRAVNETMLHVLQVLLEMQNGVSRAARKQGPQM